MSALEQSPFVCDEQLVDRHGVVMEQGVKYRQESISASRDMNLLNSLVGTMPFDP